MGVLFDLRYEKKPRIRPGAFVISIKAPNAPIKNHRKGNKNEMLTLFSNGLIKPLKTK